MTSLAVCLNRCMKKNSASAVKPIKRKLASATISTKSGHKANFEDQKDLTTQQVYFYQRCLNEELAKRLEKNPNYSLRSFALSLQIDVGALSKILNGLKIPTPLMIRKIVQQLSLSTEQEKQLYLSVAQASKKSGLQRKHPEIRAMLTDTTEHLNISEKDLTPEIFCIISDWYHYAILQLTETVGFKSDSKIIAAQLDVDESEVQMAIDRMLRLGFLRKENGTLVRSTVRLTTGDLAMTTLAFKKRIKQITEKSLHSLENDVISERNHTTMTMAIDPSKIPLAKDMIQEFMDKLSTALQCKKDHVYELQINLFPLQKKTK